MLICYKNIFPSETVLKISTALRMAKTPLSFSEWSFSGSECNRLKMIFGVELEEKRKALIF